MELGEGDERDVEVELVRWQRGGEAEQPIFVARRGDATCDGRDRAWVVDRDTREVAELEGTVTDATVRDQ